MNSSDHRRFNESRVGQRQEVKVIVKSISESTQHKVTQSVQQSIGNVDRLTINRKSNRPSKNNASQHLQGKVHNDMKSVGGSQISSSQISSGNKPLTILKNK